MGVRENKVETYYKDQIKQLGGITRKWVSPGRDGVPDQITCINGVVFVVEVKTTDGRRSSAQKREHDRLREVGMNVSTVYGHNGIDGLIRDVREYGFPMEKLYRGKFLDITFLL